MIIKHLVRSEPIQCRLIRKQGPTGLYFVQILVKVVQRILYHVRPLMLLDIAKFKLLRESLKSRLRSKNLTVIHVSQGFEEFLLIVFSKRFKAAGVLNRGQKLISTLLIDVREV
jgi:hypothetical protein